MELALYGEHGFYRGAVDGPGAAATSSRRPRSGRCSAPCSPGPSTPSGSGSAGPTRSPSSRPAPARARSPGRCSPPARRASPAALRRRRGSAAQRASASRTASSRVPTCPDGPFDGVVVANELLDNLPFRLVVSDGGWREAFVATGPGDTFVEVLRPPFDPRPPCCRRRRRTAPVRRAGRGRDWVAAAQAVLRRGRLVVVDYARPTTAELVGRPWRDWLRTYRRHERGGTTSPHRATRTSPPMSPSTSCPRPTRCARRPSSCSAWGIDELVDEGAGAGNGPPPSPIARADDAQPDP